jgi:predicted Zn-dependent protease
MLDDAYQAAAEEAVSDWNTVLDRPVFAFGWHPFVSVDIQQFPYRLDTGDGIQAIGRTYRSQRFIAVSTDIGREAYRVTVEHELGHIIGLSHSSDPNDLMCPAPGYLTRVTAEDARRALEILNREPVKSQY